MDDAGRPFSDLSAEGLHWLINKTVFHPRGYALAFHYDDLGNVIGWSLLGDGTEPYQYTEEDDDREFAKAKRFFEGE
jgi:YD repeat-containing protein